MSDSKDDYIGMDKEEFVSGFKNQISEKIRNGNPNSSEDELATFINLVFTIGDNFFVMGQEFERKEIVLLLMKKNTGSNDLEH